MKIKFKHIAIENFCGIKQMDTPLYDRTSIKGKNAVGKSTIRNAIFWVLYNKLSDGSSTDGIRPHDENGVDIDFIDISVTLMLDVDGREIELKKVQKQKWTKPRGSQEKRFDGNINEFEINGIPKKEKDYTAYIEENIAPMETLMYCTNAMAFLGLDNKKRRAKLLSLEKEFSDADVVATDKKYVQLADMLKDGTVDELIARSKKVIKAKNDELKTIPARIDELEKQKVDIDVAELELGRNALKEQIAENKSKQEDISKQYEEYQKLADGVFELKFELNDLQRNANEGLVQQKKGLQTQIDEKNEYLMNIGNGIQRNNREIYGYESDIESGTKERNRLAELWKSVNAEVFDEDTTICPTCHRKLAQSKINKLLSTFEKAKSERLAKIEKDGLEAKQDIENAKAMILKLQECNKDNFANKEKLEKEVSDLEKQLSELPQSIDISDTKEYKTIQKQIAEKETDMQQGDSADEIRQTLKAESEDLQSRLTEIEKQIAKSENNAKLDDRIEELHAEQRNIAQKVADEERTLDLLEDFNRSKVNLLTDRVNRHFELVKWQMFKPQINGGFSEVCIPTIAGTSYDGLLNDGNKILAAIDICKAFQSVNDVVCPIMVDNTESVDDWLIPKTESQLIMIEHDKKVEKLTIEEAR